MKNLPNTIGSLLESTGDYVETKVNLFKLKAVDKSSDIISSIASWLVIALFIVFGFIIINVGLCIWLGDMMGSACYGFFAIGGFYLLLGVIILSFKSKWIKQPINDLIIKKILN
jgi:hypothetical protein